MPDFIRICRRKILKRTPHVHVSRKANSNQDKLSTCISTTASISPNASDIEPSASDSQTDDIVSCSKKSGSPPSRCARCHPRKDLPETGSKTSPVDIGALKRFVSQSPHSWPHAVKNAIFLARKLLLPFVVTEIEKSIPQPTCSCTSMMNGNFLFLEHDTLSEKEIIRFPKQYLDFVIEIITTHNGHVFENNLHVESSAGKLNEAAATFWDNLSCRKPQTKGMNTAVSCAPMNGPTCVAIPFDPTSLIRLVIAMDNLFYHVYYVAITEPMVYPTESLPPQVRILHCAWFQSVLVFPCVRSRILSCNCAVLSCRMGDRLCKKCMKKYNDLSIPYATSQSLTHIMLRGCFSSSMLTISLQCML